MADYYIRTSIYKLLKGGGTQGHTSFLGLDPPNRSSRCISAKRGAIYVVERKTKPFTMSFGRVQGHLGRG